MTRDEVEVFANGLHYLANIDGIDETEAALIREFLAESGTDLTWDDIARDEFHIIEAAQTMRGTFLRRVFISAAVAIVKADGEFSSEERRALGEIADAFGISNAEFGDIERAAAGAKL